jgi:hypothetical protein
MKKHQAPMLFTQWNDYHDEMRCAYRREDKWVTGCGSRELYEDLMKARKRGETELPKCLVDYFDEIWEEQHERN